MRKQKIRVIVRPFLPRKTPYNIKTESIQEFMNVEKSKIQDVLYVGWTRRKIDEKRQLVYVVATGKTGKEARLVFKTSEDYGQNVWILT